ncbi:MAG: PEGA domain-containing protein [Deltaproteobacteria bacterium]|nr:PEGA domain-containing protein [Deltaproteobacteria bacterium]
MAEGAQEIESFPIWRKPETEWLGIELPLTGLFNTKTEMPLSPGLIIRVLTLKWESFYWTPFELGAALQIAELGTDSPLSSGAQYFAFAGTQAGLPFYLGASGQHQLLLGITSGFGVLGGEVKDYRGNSDDSDLGLQLGVALRYTYQTEGVFNYGASIRTVFSALDVSHSNNELTRVLVLASLDGSLAGIEPDSGSAFSRKAGLPFFEYFAIEWGLLGVFLGVATPPPVVGLAPILRFWTFNSEYFYWTPLEFGGGVHLGGTFGYGFYAGTQAGAQLSLGTRHRLRLGLGLGGGFLGAFSTRDSCDGQCGMGGGGFMLSPSLRYTYYSEGRTFYGSGVRFILPVQTELGVLPIDLYGALMSLYFEIGWGQAASMAGEAGQVPVETRTPEPRGDVPADRHTLVVVTQPAGARVMIDGRSVGGSPACVIVPSGKHRVHVRSRGWRTWESEVDVHADGELHIEMVEKSTLYLWGHASFWTGLGMAGFGGLSLWMAREAGWEGRNADSRAWSGAMWAGFGSGLALLATGIVFWLYETDSDGAASSPPLLVAPVVGGSDLGVDIGVRF